MTKNERAVIGYAVIRGGEHYTLCSYCGEMEEHVGVIRDGPHYGEGGYGEKVPYPECYDCGEVIHRD